VSAGVFYGRCPDCMAPLEEKSREMVDYEPAAAAAAYWATQGHDWGADGGKAPRIVLGCSVCDYVGEPFILWE
jgi:hypothetical protein